MTQTHTASRLINAPADAVYRALVDPVMVRQWLPPTGARGRIDAFDPRPGGAFCITLTFEAAGNATGKSSPDSDIVQGRFLELETNRKVTQSFELRSSDPAFAGTMTMSWTLDTHQAGTILTVTARDVPIGISAVDHEAALASSLSNLAAMIDGSTDISGNE